MPIKLCRVKVPNKHKHAAHKAKLHACASKGLEWGGNWKFVDKPHFQNLFGKSLKELRALPKDANGLPILK